MLYATRKELRTAAGHAIIMGVQGKQLTAESKELLREVRPLGVILFAHNVESPEQVFELTKELKLFIPDERILLCVDQEGGRVARIRKPATEWPPMRTLGTLNDPLLTEKVAMAMGRELRAMNFDIDFAPVLDVDTNPDNPVIGDRSFSRDPNIVSAMGAAFVRGLAKATLGGCGKHFPGHGDTDLDSHLALPKVSHDLDRLRAIEWPPYKAAFAAGLDSIMTAHVVVEALDPNVPATLSTVALSHLRDELNFSGIIVSDDIEMKAVADLYKVPEIVARGDQAGIDVYLACHKPEVILELYRSLVVRAEENPTLHENVVNREKRALKWRDRWYRSPGSPDAVRQIVHCQEHQQLTAQIQAAV